MPDANAAEAAGNPVPPVLLDAFPQEKQGAAMTIFGMAALLAPVVGPTLGGYITDNYGWRWIFYLNVPVGLLALFMCRAVVVDPDYLSAERAKARSREATSGVAVQNCHNLGKPSSVKTRNRSDAPSTSDCGTISQERRAHAHGSH